jgi:hypothetical protein
MGMAVHAPLTPDLTQVEGNQRREIGVNAAPAAVFAVDTGVVVIVVAVAVVLVVLIVALSLRGRQVRSAQRLDQARQADRHTDEP